MTLSHPEIYPRKYQFKTPAKTAGDLNSENYFE